MRSFISLFVFIAVCGTAASVKMSLSAKAHQHVEDFLASLQPYLGEQVDAKNAWPWPEDSYEMEEEKDTVKADLNFIETSIATSATGATGEEGASGATGDEEGTGSTGGEDETGAAATATTGSTGSTGGATAETGSTGATGEQESEKPKEPKDASIMFDVALTGVTVEELLSPKGMAAFADVISQKVGVSKQDVTIGSAEKHDDSNPVAKAHAEAKAKKEAQLKKLNAAVEETKTAENKDKADPETAKKEAENAKADASQESAENKVKAKEGVLLEVGAGSVDVRFTVSNIEASKAEKVATDVSSFISDDSADGFAKACAAKGLKVSGAKLNREPAIEGGKPKAGCAKAVLKFLGDLKDKNTPETEVPARMRGFCKKSFNDRKNVLPASLSPTVIARTCERAFGIFNRRPIGKRYEASVPESREYCYEMRQFFEYLIRKNGVTNMKHGLATSVSEINREAPGQGITACCVPHQSGGCFDKKPNKNIQECVCNGGVHSHHPSKKDKFCCDTEWDLTCAENVEWYGCAACPQPEFLFRR